jgi:hypothetical protein
MPMRRLPCLLKNRAGGMICCAIICARIKEMIREDSPTLADAVIRESIVSTHFERGGVLLRTRDN